MAYRDFTLPSVRKAFDLTFQEDRKNDTQVDTVYGAVTTGTNWKFLTLTGKTVTIDAGKYYIKEVSKILAILMLPFSETRQLIAV
ncbi:MAG: hypothetical protein AAGF01_15440 [Cyanobacteria bacterium P01_G01_bin.38]